jgi:hypothetical protein
MSDNKQKSYLDKREEVRDNAYSISKPVGFTLTAGIKTGAAGESS